MLRTNAFALCGLFLVLSSFPAQGSQDFLSLQRRIVELFEENRDAVVRVKAIYESSEDAELPQVVIGTGFFISREGLILTNALIVNQPLRVWVEHENIPYASDIIGVDPTTNLALLRVHSLPESFEFLNLTDSTELPPIGTIVLQIAMPLEFEASPAMGLVVGHESRVGSRLFPCNHIRTSIPASPATAGSAYLDLSGRLVGIQVGSLPEIGATYLLPARAAVRIRDDLLFGGEVVLGWIGFEVREERSLKDGTRLLVTKIVEDTPAAEADIRKGDVLERIGNYTIGDLDDLNNAMFYSRVGQYVDVRLRREGEIVSASVQLGERPPDEPLVMLDDPELENARQIDIHAEKEPAREKVPDAAPAQSIKPRSEADPS